MLVASVAFQRTVYQYTVIRVHSKLQGKGLPCKRCVVRDLEQDLCHYA